MTKPAIDAKLTHPLSPVKSPKSNMSDTSPKPLIHHKEGPYITNIIYKNKGKRVSPRYGVSTSKTVLSPGLFIKRFDGIRDCLRFTLGLTAAEREVALRLLRYWVCYGNVYPKEATITALPGCSKATYWRTVRKLRALNLLLVVNRYIIRVNAQISNLYRFDRLVILLARYLAEHGALFREKWLEPYLQLPGRDFWGSWVSSQESRAGPCG